MKHGEIVMVDVLFLRKNNINTATLKNSTFDSYSDIFLKTSPVNYQVPILRMIDAVEDNMIHRTFPL